MRSRERAFLAVILALTAAGIIVFLVSRAPERAEIRPLGIPVEKVPATASTEPDNQTTRASIRPTPFVELFFENEESPSSRSTSRPMKLLGQVFDFDGSPAAHAHVSVFGMNSGVPSKRRNAMSADVEGRFELMLWPPHSSEWLICATRDERRPATLRIQHDSIVDSPPVKLLLSEGETIAGSVRVDGNPASRARVWADIRPGVAPTLGDLWWESETIEQKIIQTYTDDRGRFRLRGLGPHTYLIAAENVVDPHQQFDQQVRRQLGLGGASRRGPLMGSLTKEVTAPSSGVDLEIATATLGLRVLSGGRLLPDAQVVVTTSRGDSVVGTMETSFEVKVAAGGSHSIHAAAPGFAPKTLDVPPLGAGERRTVDVPLSPNEDPELRLTLRGAEALALEAVKIRFVETSPKKDEVNRATADLRNRLVATRTRQNEFIISRVPYPPGRYIVLVFPNTPDSWLVPTEVEIELPERGAVEATADAIIGGKLKLTVVNPEGAAVPYSMVLHDSAGVETLRRKGLADGGEGSEVLLFGPAYARRDSATLRNRYGIIAPGNYEMVVNAAELEGLRRQVTVSAGATTTELVRLSRPTVAPDPK